MQLKCAGESSSHVSISLKQNTENVQGPLLTGREGPLWPQTKVLLDLMYPQGSGRNSDLLSESWLRKAFLITG